MDYKAVYKQGPLRNTETEASFACIFDMHSSGAGLLLQCKAANF